MPFSYISFPFCIQAEIKMINEASLLESGPESLTEDAPDERERRRRRR
jgi:hypothetical protein